MSLDMVAILLTIFAILLALFFWLLPRKELYLICKSRKPKRYLSEKEDDLFIRYSKGITILSIENKYDSEDLPVHVVFDNSKSERRVSLCNIKTCWLDDLFTLDKALEVAVKNNFPRYKKMLERRKKKFFENTVVRLMDFSFCSRKNEVKLWLQPVGYFTACKTQRILDAPLDKGGETIRSIVHANGLEDLNQSRLANSLGYSTLLFTVGNELIIQRRSRKVIAFAKSLGPASSGAYNARDFNNRDKNAPFPFRPETEKELGTRDEDINNDSVKFLGITRELYRGGKPEMFFLAKTRLSKHRIVERRGNAPGQWESSHLIFHPFKSSVFKTELSEKEKNDFRKDMTDLLSKHMKDMSYPLLSALALWQKHVL